MTPRLWALSLAPVLAASTAYAQAPGEVEAGASQQQYAPPTYAPPTYAPPTYYAPQRYAQPPPRYAPPPYAPPSYAPPPYAPAVPDAPPPEVAPMAHRWALGLSFGGLGVAPEVPEGAAEGPETQFRVAELSVRYRASRRIELSLAMSGGREVLKDDTDGDLATGTVMLALRYRFMPERRWNWFLTGGFGGTVVESHTANAAQRDAAQRPLGMLGIGLERRFRRFALQAELRMVGLGQRNDSSGDMPVPDVGGAGSGGGGSTGGEPPPKPLPTGPQQLLPANSAAAVRADSLDGGMFTLGASYYF
jgi:hypothetical protein